MVGSVKEEGSPQFDLIGGLLVLGNTNLSQTFLVILAGSLHRHTYPTIVTMKVGNLLA